MSRYLSIQNMYSVGYHVNPIQQQQGQKSLDLTPKSMYSYRSAVRYDVFTHPTACQVTSDNTSCQNQVPVCYRFRIHRNSTK